MWWWARKDQMQTKWAWSQCGLSKWEYQLIRSKQTISHPLNLAVLICEYLFYYRATKHNVLFILKTCFCSPSEQLGQEAVSGEITELQCFAGRSATNLAPQNHMGLHVFPKWTQEQPCHSLRIAWLLRLNCFCNQKPSCPRSHLISRTSLDSEDTPQEWAGWVGSEMSVLPDVHQLITN